MALPVVFWGYGVTTSVALAMLRATALNAGQLIFQQVLVLSSAAHTIWILVAIWRCAPNTGPFSGTLARWRMVTWGSNTAFVLLVHPDRTGAQICAGMIRPIRGGGSGPRAFVSLCSTGRPRSFRDISLWSWPPA